MKFDTFFIGFLSSYVLICFFVICWLLLCATRHSLKKTVQIQTEPENLIQIPLIVIQPDNDISLTNEIIS